MLSADESLARRPRTHRLAADDLRWEKPCHRYFQGKVDHVALVDVDCPHGGWIDGRVLMGLSPTGEHLNPPWTLDGRGVVERICPGDRNRFGREAHGKWLSTRCIFSPAAIPPPERVRTG